MMLRHYFCINLIILMLLFQTTFGLGDSCTCRCPNINKNEEVCDTLKKLDTEKDVTKKQFDIWTPKFKLFDNWEDEKNNFIQGQKDGLKALSNSISDIQKQTVNLENKLERVEEKLQSAEKTISKLETNLQEERIARLNLEEKMLQNFSIIISTTEKQNLELQNNMSALQAKLQKAENLAKSLESELRKERDAMKELEINFLGNFSSAISKMEIRSLVLQGNISDIEEKLSSAKQETKKLKLAFQEEKKEVTSFKENIVQTFSSRMSTFENESRELNFSISKIKARQHFVENQTEHYASAIAAEEEARKKLEKEIVQDFSTRMATFENSSREVESDMFDFEERLQFVEDQTENCTSAILAEEESRKKLEEDIVQTSSRMSTFENESRELNFNISKIEARQHFVENQTEHYASSIAAEEEARKKFEEQTVRDISTRMAAFGNRSKEVLSNMFDIEERLQFAENQAENFKSAMTAEGESRKKLENSYIEQQTELSTIYDVLGDKISKVEANVSDFLNVTKTLQSKLQTEIDARLVLQHDFEEIRIKYEIENGRRKRRSIKALETPYNEVGKFSSVVENRAAETVISEEKY